MIQSDFGKVEVNSIKIHTNNGQHLVFDLYKPHSATKNNQAPFIIVVPGFQRSKENRFQDIPPTKAQDHNCNGRSYSADLAPLVQKYQTSYTAV